MNSSPPSESGENLIQPPKSALERLHLTRQLQHSLKQNPKNPEALYKLGVLMDADGLEMQAIEHFKKALSLKKKDQTILLGLVTVLEKKRMFQEAKKYARKLVELAPRQVRYLMIYAGVFEAQGNVKQSRELLEKALKIDPNNIEALNRLTRVLLHAGLAEETGPVYERILAIKPQHPDALYNYCNSRKFSKAECDAITQQIDIAIEKTEEAIQKAQLNYANGKIHQDCGEYDKAFPYYKKANELRLRRHDKSPFLEIANAKAVLTDDLIKSKRGFGDETKQPIFIFGLPRSGTTLTESICGAHSKITAGDELAYIAGLLRPMGFMGDEPDHAIEVMKGLTRAQFKELSEHYLEMAKPVAGNTPHFTDKMPHNFVRVGFIKMLFPNAKLIHCRRHPIDNCVSLFTNSMRNYHNSYKTDLGELGLYYRQYAQLMEQWRQLFPGGMHEVYYEDVVANTELNARKLIETIGLEWEDGVMDRQKSQKSVKTLSAWQVRQPVYTTSAGRWRNYEKHLGPLIDTLGPEVEKYEAELANLS